MNTPKIRFKGFKDDWEQRKLGDVLKERTERAKGEEELLSVTIANGVIRQADSEKRNIASEDKRNYKVVKKGDIPYNSMRMWQGAVGNSQYDGIVSPAYTILVPTDEANDKFFMELFKKENSLQRFKRWSQGLTSDTWNLKYPALSTMQFFIPSIKEQKRIANCLQELDHLITLHQRKCDETKELKKFMLQKMFPKNGEKNPEIRFEGFTDDWEQRKLGDICEQLSQTIDPKRTPNARFEEYSMPAFDQNMKATVVEGSAMNSTRKIISKECLLINKLNVRKKRIWLVEKPSDNAVCSAEFIPICSDEINLRYLKYFTLNDSFTKYLEDCSSGSSNSQKRVTPDIIMNAEIIVPVYAEQKKIGDYFRNLDHLITLHQRKCEKLKELKKFMLQNMFV